MSKCGPAIRNVLLVSKPVAPPWNDSSKNLARDLGAHLSSYQGLLMGRAQPQAPQLGRARVLSVYRDRRIGGFSPPMSAQWPVLTRLLSERESSLWHFFFAPNLRTSTVARACAQLRGRPTVQTVCSAPANGTNLRQVLFADMVVVLSEHSRRRCLAAGVAADRVVHIPPCIPPLPVPDLEQRRVTRIAHALPTSAPIILYPGDLEFSDGARRALACLAALPSHLDAHLVLCCRDKTPAAFAARAELTAAACRAGLGPRVHMIGETPAIHDLLYAADIVLLPAETLYAKMDLPLVLLEAMALGRPVLVLSGTPAAELAQDGAALAVDREPGALAIATEALLEDDTRRAKMGERARERVAAWYNPPAMARAYEAVYDRLL